MSDFAIIEYEYHCHYRIVCKTLQRSKPLSSKEKPKAGIRNLKLVYQARPYVVAALKSNTTEYQLYNGSKIPNPARNLFKFHELKIHEFHSSHNSCHSRRLWKWSDNWNQFLIPKRVQKSLNIPTEQSYWSGRNLKWRLRGCKKILAWHHANTKQT